ncbi:hypothetical protein CVT24_013177 [Panaeolus cyanescens]|uniref:Uncharacterized protein n=1 Tax=Panaeolus cyanescens TaxID=181874 RepID=A0A409VW08_9AGAR|nr:hypothetical protein CVT24_013177 [Panaeolus cyanescens]
MQDGGERSLSLPLPSQSVLGEVASAAASGLNAGSSGSSENRIFVVATLAAIVLAGSAFAYRARPHAASLSKNDLVASSVRDSQRDGTDSTPRVVPGGKGKDPQGSSTPPQETTETKESKSSRSKDRRRRGKDPLKDVLKNPKKLKSLATATPSSTPPLSARSTLATTSTPATTPNTASSTAHINSIKYNTLPDDETTDDTIDPTSEFPSPFNQHTSSSNASSLQGSISRSKGKQVLQQELEQEREYAWQDTLPIPVPSPGLISASHTADTSEVSQTDTLQTIPQAHRDQPADAEQPTSQPSHLSPTSGPDLDQNHHQIPNHTYAGPALSFAPSMSQKYPSTTRLPPSSTASPSVTSIDDDEGAALGHISAGIASGPQGLEDLQADTISQARSRFLARDDTSRLGLGLSLRSPATPPDFCSALSSTSSSAESTELSASTMTTNTSVTSGAASSDSNGEESGMSVQSPRNPERSTVAPKPSHASADSSSSSSSSKTKHAPKAQPLPSAAASSSKAKQAAIDPWEWDGVSDAVRKLEKADTLKKEKATNSRDSPKKGSRKAGTTFSAIAAGATTASPSEGNKELDIIEETPLSFPTLNPTPTISSRSKIQSEGAGSNGQQPSTPRRAPTPRRPQTPSYNSNNHSNCSTPPPPSSTSSSSSHHPPSNGSSSGMPALSTQTQLASVRGALEASRLREEKNKAEIERVTKEMERLQWENANCKRGEMELRKQIAYLMHQVHSYASMFAAVSPQFNLHLQQQLQLQNQHAHNLSISSQNGASTTDSGSTRTLTDSSPSASVALDGAKPSASSTPPPLAAQDSTQPQDSPTSSPSTAVPASTPVATSGGSVTSSTISQPATPAALHPLQVPAFPGLQMNGNTPAGLTSPISSGALPNPAQFFQYPFSQQLPGQHFNPHHMGHMQPMLPFQHVGSPVQPSPHLPAFFNNPSAANGRVSVNGSPSIPSFADAGFGLHHFHPAQASTSSPLNGPSSSGSLSPELNGSPNPGINGIANKRQSRNRNQRLNGRAGWEDSGDGWIGANGNRIGDDREGQDNQDQQDDAESEGGFNELLADAILKRPGSIRVRSPKKGKSADDERDTISEADRMTEFAFPSLSDMGNVLYRSGTRNVTEQYPTPSSSSVSSPSAEAALSSLSSSPKKLSTPVPIDSLNAEESTPPKDFTVSEDSSAAPVSPDSDTTPRKESVGVNVVQASAHAQDNATSEEPSYETDQQPPS